MHVPYNYLPYEFADIEDIFRDWANLIKTTEFTLGSYVNDFESMFADYVGAKHCISTNNGTDALLLSLKALELGASDEVITVTNTFYATAGAIVACGATPVLVDCDERFQISVESVEQAITSRTKAILPVHWAGASPDMPALLELAKAHSLNIIEDACMAIGASVAGRKPGSFGQAGAFSMHPLKSLNVMGDGGMVVTDDDKIAEWMQKYRNHGMVDRDHIDFWGVNMRLQPLQAVVAMHRLSDLDQTIRIRNQNAGLYDHALEKLGDCVDLPQRNKNETETFSLYMGLFKERDSLSQYLNQNGIETKIHYPIPLHKQKAAQQQCRISGDMPNANYQAEHLLTLPVHQYLVKEQILYTINCIKNFYGKE